MLFYFRDKGPALAYVAVCNDVIKPTPFSVVNEEPVGLVSAPVASDFLGNQAPFHQTSQGGWIQVTPEQVSNYSDPQRGHWSSPASGFCPKRV